MIHFQHIFSLGQKPLFVMGYVTKSLWFYFRPEFIRSGVK